MKFGKKRGYVIDQNKPDYRLREAAAEDLIQIALYSFENFGLERSEKYRDKLKKQFAVIASNSLRFVSVDYIKMDYHQSVCGSHSIYYRIEKKGVLILRILGQQDTSKAF
ncbi:MAG: toxin ParE1/3/4 [Gammaproteobacteria bacterium]|jgi:toxin ParE1/3/4